MLKIHSIASGLFQEMIRQPVHLLLVAVSAGRVEWSIEKMKMIQGTRIRQSLVPEGFVLHGSRGGLLIGLAP